MEYTFKGINSSTMGVTVLTQPQFKTAERRMTFIDIDGRDGSVTYPSGYKHYSTEMTIAIEDFDRMEQIRGWMTGDGLFIRSDNPDRYIKVTIDGNIDYTHLQFGIHTAVITLNVYDPFWYKVPREDNLIRTGNLIRTDFSDFLPYQGSVVTRNKTFPIETFKGGRNYLPEALTHPFDSWQKMEDGSLRTKRLVNIELVQYTDVWELVDGWTYTLQLEIKLDEGEVLFDSRPININSKTEAISNLTKVTSEWQRMAVSFYYISTTIAPVMVLRFTSDIPSNLTIRNQKITIGSNLEDPYAPAPEDGFHYNGPNPAYHIETYGGDSTSKYWVPAKGTENLRTTASMKVYPFKTMSVADNRGNITEVPNYETTLWESTSKGVTRENIQAMTDRVEDPLDFIASDPYITGYAPALYGAVTTSILNEGNIYSKPMIRISYTGPRQKELRMSVGNTQMIYNWPANEKEVEYDTSTGYSYHQGQRRDRHWHRDMAPFSLPIGTTKVVKETRYTTMVEVKEESRWR